MPQLIKELSTNKKSNKNSTYKKIHSKLISKYFQKVKDENQCLPSIYCIPKLHKNQSKARFIITTPKGALRALSKSITSVFNVIYKQIESKQSTFFFGITSFWTILSNQPVINSITNLNNRGKAASASCFDFPNL